MLFSAAAATIRPSSPIRPRNTESFCSNQFNPRHTTTNPIPKASAPSFRASCSERMAELGVSREADAILGAGFPDSGRKSTLEAVNSTVNHLSKWVVAGLFGVVILWKHDAEVLWAAMGSVVNSWLSVTLKHILNHERPIPSLKPDPGMPSTHAQSIFFAAVFAVLSLLHWLGTNYLTVVLGAGTLSFASYLSWLRVSQRLHTWGQVLVGAALGSVCAAAWFMLWHLLVSKAFASSILVRIAVVLGSVIVCSVFFVYVIRHWLQESG